MVILFNTVKMMQKCYIHESLNRFPVHVPEVENNNNPELSSNFNSQDYKYTNMYKKEAYYWKTGSYFALTEPHKVSSW